MEAKHTPTPWIERNERVLDSAGNVIATVWPVGGEVDETQLPGESWIDMRERTRAARQQKQAETKANAVFITRACNAWGAISETLDRCYPQWRNLGSDDASSAKAAIEIIASDLVRAKEAPLAKAGAIHDHH